MLLRVHCLDRTMLTLGVERKLAMALAGNDSLYLGVLEVTHDHGTALQPGKRQQNGPGLKASKARNPLGHQRHRYKSADQVVQSSMHQQLLEGDPWMIGSLDQRSSNCLL
jgi:hypothetical protein